jgi:aminopeptidase N
MATACGHNYGEASGSAVAAPVYRHVRADFGPLVTRPLHLDLEFDITESAVRVTCRTTFLHTADAPLRSLQLNSKELEIVSVELLTGGAQLPAEPSSAAFVAHVAALADAAKAPLTFDVDTKGHFLNVALPEPIQKGQQFTLRTVSVAKPTAHILEGLYYDWTPEGAPKTIITQVGEPHELCGG